MKTAIRPGVAQRLGRKTFYLISLRRMHPALGLFVLAIVLVALQQLSVSFFQNDPQAFLKISSVLNTIMLFTSLLFLLALGGALFSAWLSYKNYTFTFEENALRIRRGIFNKEQIDIPYRQIQDVDIERPLFYRLFGVSRLVILTAGREEGGKTDESEGVLPALDADLAEAIEKELTTRANIEEVREEPVQASAPEESSTPQDN